MQSMLVRPVVLRKGAKAHRGGSDSRVDGERCRSRILSSRSRGISRGFSPVVCSTQIPGQFESDTIRDIYDEDRN